METKMLRSGKALSQRAQSLLDIEKQYAVGGFAPVPGFIASGQGSTLVDVDGNRVIDFTCMMSAANLGHCHPKMVHAMTECMQKVTLTNLAIHNDGWPEVAKTLCEKFGYDKVATMVSGAEAADSACKIARKWGIKQKGISPEDVLVLGCSGNYHGLTSGIWPIMNPGQQADYAVTSKHLTNCNPTTKQLLRYGHLEDFEEVLKTLHHRVAAVILECIHGQLPTFEEEISFAVGVRQLQQHSFISDEIRMGSGKTGKFLCSDWLGAENKPDMLTLGKSITGGSYPASYVLGNDEVMSLVKPYQVGSTFAQAPAANTATLTALRIYEEENLVQKANDIAEKWTQVTSSWRYPFVAYTTCRGADACIMLKEHIGPITSRRIAMLAFQKGLLIYPAGQRLRVGMALTISPGELLRGLEILTEVMDEIEFYGEIPGDHHEADETEDRSH